LPELLNDIAKQTGNRLDVDSDLRGDAVAKSDIKLDDVIFWEAIEQINTQRKIFPVADAHGRLMLTSSTAVQLPVAIHHAGVLRADLAGVHRHPVAGDPTQRLIRLRGELMLEPRLRPLFVHFRERDFTTVDPDGNSLAPWNPEARYELTMG